ncbi:MAG: response regulator [Myxococcota bacterium]
MIPLPQRPVVLVVDDVESNRTALTTLLADDTVEIVAAHSGLEALEILLVRDVAVALIDVQMPEMDGFELAELMRGTERTRLVPIIFVTGSARDEQRAFRGYDTGAVDYLYKPVEPSVLRNKVQVFVDLWCQRQRIAETLRLNEMFTAVLSHDLRSPLAVITNGAALLEARPTPETIQQVAPRIRRTALRMGEMINDLLDLTRARLSSGIPVVRKAADLGVIAEAVCTRAAARQPRDHAAAHARGRPAGRGTRGVGQALTNLVANAIRHGSQGPVLVGVDGRQRGAVSVLVHNEGQIDPELLPRVFDPFLRGEQGGEGLGLGLFIVREVARAHGGDVGVMSGPGIGTSFRVQLPRTAS